ncbi:MAG TPA: cellulase family glycosylhydrolase, partial [Polyangiaceae bacterium]|nr:cellulase family glycosylhydrolase [Polyangiaceae bacterium]
FSFSRPLWASVAWCSVCVSCLKAADRGPKSTLDLSRNPPANFEVDGAPLCFVGTNNYYLAYKPKPMVDDVLESARAMGIKVVRIWGFIDRGSLDGSVRSTDGDGTKDGFYFQAWDPEQRRAVYNDGPNGLVGLDYALFKAGQLGLKIVLVLTNNWKEFGGMDQYLAWYGLSAHQDFYTEARVKQSYKDWAYHLVSRENSLTHRAYRDDPTIFAWELGNEPRGGRGTPSSVLTSWAEEMSGYLKSIDSNHLVAVGDEGFLDGGGEHWTYQANDGVDHRALTGIRAVDYGTFHMYPEDWGTGFAWADHWISEHERVARELGKPTVLEEYGVKVVRDEAGQIASGLERRVSLYARWNELTLERGGNAAMFWMLAGAERAGGVYQDYDHYSVYRGDAAANLLADFAKRFATDAPACLSATNGAASANPSPFVRVRGPRPTVVLGWLPDAG